ncbi:MAG: nucleotidyltransferase [Deltaproteobacteria bacterium CG_4_10_14_0_2_um_filter_43_8]|nr:MAG: nucleotidyltransferase [Deltaproteobacteria bacterium CG11_big_fil_rev_8_21_14_0_20_42_23]PJA19747.1 MAG: nucleotidyltransferase [Deltaproteobacteria bacterium CG_4_10_14_0_2_um_filter_43_8]PJC64438.1 MAG: nucleotidyltransferase [Deltaproteobacteria bacterium CG_4_9_14_0_2_um_filter_42_21]
MNQKDIRWKQRFQNFENAFFNLENTIAISNPSIAERAGLIQFFEITFELSWKTLKDYLESVGFQTASPRETLKQAFQEGTIQNGHLWIKALEDRNLTTHTYNEATAQKVEKLIREDYFPLLKQLHTTLKGKLTS